MPMSIEEVTAYFARLGLSSLARELISSARNGAPARRVSPAGSLNTPWRYASTKMGWTISVESSEEHTYAVLYEYDDEIIEYWEQPFEVQFPVTAKNGHTRRTSYHPDFLVLKRDRVELVQVKTRQAIDELQRLNPNRWKLIGADVHDVAADTYFGDFGLPHLIVSEGQINRIRADNCLLLMRAVDQPPLKDLEKATQRAVVHLEKEPISTLASLLEAIGTRDTTAILQMVHAKAIAVDLDFCRISRLHECPVALNSVTLHRYLEATNWHRSLNPSIGPHLAPEEVLEAYSRFQQVTGEVSPKRCPRTLQRWRAKLRGSGNDPFSLGPRVRFRGNRLRRLSPSETEVIERSISTHYLTPLSPPAQSCYGHYLLDLDSQIAQGRLPASTRPVSYVTYLKHCRQLDPEHAAMARGGRRLANARRAPVAPELKCLKPLRPFERGHIDHYTCDLHVVVAPEFTNRATKRPWLTLLRDEFSGAVLAMSVSFLPPSRRSCMAVVRDCVRRHQRLPEAITVDNGKEFESAYFELLLAHYRISKQSRPPGAPRFGASVERVFGNLAGFLKGLPGNTTNDARGRSASPEVRGQRQAKLDIYAAYQAIEAFFFQYFNLNPGSNQLQSPQHLLVSTLGSFPFSGTPIAFDDAFLARTSLPIGKLKVDKGRGVRHLDRWFSSAALMCANRRSVEAYQEPWDLNRLYVLVDGELVTCVHGPLEPRPLFSTRHVLDSLLALECADVRSELQRSKAKSVAKLTRTAVRRRRRPTPMDRPDGMINLPPLASDLDQLDAFQEGDDA